MLAEKEAELERHRIFSQFLDAVVQDQSGDKEGFSDIMDLQNRFKSLKNENQQLLQRKRQIEEEMKEAKVREQRRLSELKNTLYEQQRNMQNIQSELEEISAANSALE